MRSLTSVRKTWELCFCHVSWALQHDSILKDLWALQAGPGGWWPLPSQTVRDTLAEILPGGGELWSLTAVQTLHISTLKGQAVGSLGCRRLLHARLIWSYLILSLPHLLQIFPHPTDPPKSQPLKKKKCTGKHIPKQPDEKNHIIKIRVVIVTMGVFQPLQFI